MTLTAWTGTAMALVVSSIVKTERAALTSVPLLLVPQMLLAGALVSYKEMNRGLFQNAREFRERGGVPVPAVLMPLRYSYEAMVVAQAVRNPFEVERIRLQRRIDRVRRLENRMSERETETFELAKEGLRRLLAAGAADKREAADLVARIRRISSHGTRIEVETMKVWPEENPDARPASDFFVNERIDLLVREAETFRNDYRHKEPRVVFLSLKKPLPWAETPGDDPLTFVEPAGHVETQKFCALVLGGIVIACCLIATAIISRQNRLTR
jgi:hypothetical protein